MFRIGGVCFISVGWVPEGGAFVHVGKGLVDPGCFLVVGVFPGFFGCFWGVFGCFWGCFGVLRGALGCFLGLVAMGVLRFLECLVVFDCGWCLWSVCR